MSSKQIKQALVKKGYPVESVKYIRNAPTSSGYRMEFDNFQQAMDWVNSLPDINQLRKEQE